MKAGGWERRKGIELEGRTLGLMGCGQIGQIVARLALAFDMTVVAYDPYPNESFAPSACFSFVSEDELLGQADIISLHCPAREDGSPVIDQDAIGKMKDGVYLVNTARGSLIDSDAALAALESGKIAGITLDAFNMEPPDDRRLVDDSRIIATPHIGSYTQESVSRAIDVAVDNLLAELLG